MAIEGFLSSPGCLALVWTVSVGALIISLHNALHHVKNYTKPSLQRYIVRIILVVPVYSLSSVLSLQFPVQALYFDVIRDCYEAFVIYCFLTVMLMYTGGDAACLSEISHNPGIIRHPWPLCLLPEIPLDGRFLRWCKQGTIQFIVVKPVMAIISLIMLAAGLYESSAYQWLLLITYNVSYSMALYVLFLFYLATKGILREFHPIRKFFAVKSVVFMTYWQSLAVSVIPGLSKEERGGWNDFILCCEMLVAALLHYRAFSYKEFVGGIPDTSVLENMGEVLSVRDVYQDTIHSFKPSYQDYVLQAPGGAEQRGEAPIEAQAYQPHGKTFRAKTFIIGNLGNQTRKPYSHFVDEDTSSPEFVHDSGLVLGASVSSPSSPVSLGELQLTQDLDGRARAGSNQSNHSNHSIDLSV